MKKTITSLLFFSNFLFAQVNLEWLSIYNVPGNVIDGASSLAVDASGNVYVTGESDGIGPSPDYATIKYNSSGVQQWVARYNGPGNAIDFASSLAVDASGNVYVTGESDGIGPSPDYATIKYSDQIGIQPISNVIPNEFRLEQNYPNPFNPTTNIKIQIPEREFVKLTVYDITGREAAVLVNEELSAGIYLVDFNASNLSSGTYLYKLSSGSYYEVKKMILIK